jgi:hypothetical protein
MVRDPDGRHRNPAPGDTRPLFHKRRVLPHPPRSHRGGPPFIYAIEEIIMAARDQIVTVPANEWTRITDNLVSNVTFQNLSSYEQRVRITPDTTAPATPGGLRYLPGQGEANRALADLRPTVTSGHVWVRCDLPTEVWVSHAA